MKQIVFDGLNKMVKGLDVAADLIGGTIGPKGRNVFIDDSMSPTITNDGATISDRIILQDEIENAGAYVIRNVAAKQNDEVGDGTTTVSVLTQAIVQECLKRPENAMEVKESLKLAGESVLRKLLKNSIKIKDSDIKKVALVSSENENIAQLITEIVTKLGENAVVNVEDSKTFATDYEIVDGYEAHVGFMSPHFVTEKKSGRAIYTNIPVLVSDKKISNIQDIAPVFEMFKNEQISQCVIVCEDIDDSMLGVLVQNKLMGSFSSLVIKATGWLLQDIEGVTGATAISTSSGVTFQSFKKEHLGFAKKIVCNANSTLFATDGVSAKKYSDILETQADTEPNQFAAKKLHERVAKLRGGIAVLRIGAATDLERDYLRRKAEDSVKAVQAALSEGIVEGGGMTLWNLSKEITGNSIGDQILKKALKAPLKKIIENSGKDYTDVITNMPEGMGYDAKDDKYVNMIEEGIIDPAKVERCALENSISAASTFISTFASIIEINEKNK